ncbi:MAG: DUF86 domain-containing protein [Clostridiales bacterium]|nr:DUF86 domain-containing protein [Clostridiales bacterium]
MKYTDHDRLERIYIKGSELIQYIQDNSITREDLLSTTALQWLVTTPLYNIGEHVYYLSDEFKSVHSDIPWSMISGLRHRLVHDYEGTNWNIICDVVFNELPEFIKCVHSCL